MYGFLLVMEGWEVCSVKNKEVVAIIHIFLLKDHLLSFSEIASKNIKINFMKQQIYNKVYSFIYYNTVSCIFKAAYYPKPDGIHVLLMAIFKIMIRPTAAVSMLVSSFVV